MVKNKLVGIITSVALIAGVGAGAVGISNNTKIINQEPNTIKVQDKVLLAAPIENNNNRAVVVNTNDSPLVLYKNANKENGISSYISVGEMLTVEGHSNGFYKVKVQETGSTGYISAYNIQFITSGINKVYTSINKKGYVINVDSSVHLRENATMNSNTLANLSNDTIINILGRQGNWYKVQVGNLTGYLYGEYVGVTNTNMLANTKNNVTTTKTATTNNSQVKVNDTSGQEAYKYTIQESVISTNGKNILPIRTIYQGNKFNLRNIKSLDIPKGYTVNRIRVFDNNNEIATAGLSANNSSEIAQAISNFKINPNQGDILIQYTVVPVKDNIITNKSNYTGPVIQKMNIEAYAGTYMPKVKVGQNDAITVQPKMTQAELNDNKLVMTKDLYSYKNQIIKDPTYYAVEYNQVNVFGNMAYGGYSIQGMKIGGKICIIIPVAKGQNIKNIVDGHRAPLQTYPILMGSNIIGFIGNANQVYKYEMVK
ncbi:MAG: SH3 domain-containing protein [Sarcina sp.]